MFALLLAYSTFFVATDAVKIEMITMPRPAFVGEDAELFCAFNMENKKLYALKWFKDNIEFYRYLPKETPSTKIYDTDGVVVDRSLSRGGKVHLTKVTLSTAGDYKCLVSEEKPIFRTKSITATFIVYDIPDKGPEIYSVQEKYRIGEKAMLNCTSRPSYPESKLKWFINNMQAGDSEIISFPKRNLSNGRFQVIKQLTFAVSRDLLDSEGKIIVQCWSSIEKYYNKSDTRLIFAEVVTSLSSRKHSQEMDVAQELSDPSLRPSDKRNDQDHSSDSSSSISFTLLFGFTTLITSLTNHLWCIQKV
ncbi:Uncharacterised protein g6627 [Pycnogonum litorale]